MIKNQAADTLLQFETEETETTLLQDDIPEVVVPLVQLIEPHNDEQNRSSPEKHCDLKFESSLSVS